jgi:RNA polymerase sigma-70 factor, ECF subfamily
MPNLPPNDPMPPLSGNAGSGARDSTLLDLVAQARAGNQAAVDRVFELVYGDLRAAAQRILGPDARHTLGATEIVNEAYLRMRASDFPDVTSRRHLVNTAAIVLRRVLLDHIKSKSRAKRGGKSSRLPVDPSTVPAVQEFGIERFEQVHRLLDELEAQAPVNAEVLVLRAMLGLPMEQIAELLDISPTTAKLRWRLGIAWLRKRLGAPDPESDLERP